MKTRIGKKATGLLIAFILAVAGFCVMPMTAFAAAGDIPDHAKLLQVNPDGTYTIALNVTGDSEKQIQKVNVIVIVDRSGSMDTQSGTGAYVPSNQNGTNMYGLVDGEYVSLTRVDHGWGANPRYTYNVASTGESYTGQRYQYDSTASRMQATKAAVVSLAGTLLDYNGKDGNPSDTVEMALVTFGTTATTNVSKSSDKDAYVSTVNGLSVASGNQAGTNWEAALNQANGINFEDSDPTYVIFFSDGSPTFRTTNAGHNDPFTQVSGVYGSGQEEEPNMSWAYNEATDNAATLATKVGTDRFYTIFAYGSSAGSTYMTNLTAAAGAPAGNNYSASSTAELNDAFASILESIEMAGIGAVSMEDGTTSSVTTTSGGVSNLLTVDTSSYKYYRAGGTNSDGTEKYDSDANTITDVENVNHNVGEVWDDAPTATFENGAVKWDLTSEGVLENDVTYTVTFDCWPSQTTLDIAADIMNDPSSYNSLDANIKKYINPDGSLKTNTTASLSYTDTRTGESGTEEYENPDPVTTSAIEQLAVSKEWENAMDGRQAEPITLTVTRDESPKYTMTLGDKTDPETGEPIWTDNVYISIGILRHTNTGEYTDSAGNKFEVLETGHEFTFEEPSDLGYYWELEVPIVRPMMIDGTVTMLIKKDADHTNPDGATEYTIDGATYYVGSTGAASLTATNHRRARLNLTKVVDGEDADPDQTFPFTLNVVDSKANEGSADNLNSDYWVWFSVWNGGYVDALESGAEKEYDAETGEWTGFYYAPSGTDIVVNLKKGDNLRFTNLPVGSTYTFTEGTLPDNYAFTSSVLGAKTWDAQGNEITVPNSEADPNFAGAQTTTGNIMLTNTDYTVTYTNTYDLTDIEITKVWVDNENQDGLRPSDKEFADYLTLKADGTDVTEANAKKLKITDNGDGTYTVKWTGLDRYAEGKEIKYTVEEAEIQGYTTEYANEGDEEGEEGGEATSAEDHGTITNTHTPEKTSVKVTKAWDDADDQDKIRPASVQVKLMVGDDAQSDPVTLNDDNKWTYTWTELDKYAGGELIEYTVEEVKTEVITGKDDVGTYKDIVSGDITTGFTVTNLHTPAITTVTVTKVWDDEDNKYETRPDPEEVTVTLLANGAAATQEGVVAQQTLNDDNKWTYTWTDLNIYANGEEIDYSVEEDQVPNYKTAIEKTGVSENGYQITVTNSNVTIDTAEVDFFSKVVDVANPTKDTTFNFTIEATSVEPEGVTAPMPTTTNPSVTYSAGEDDEKAVDFGTITFTEVGVYTYTITEGKLASGWNTEKNTATVTVEVYLDDNGKLQAEVTEDATITNTYKAEGTATLKATKALAGAAWPEGKTLTLTLTGGDGAPMPETTTAELTAAGDVTFGPIAYTEADAGKTYNYTISEDGFGGAWTGSADVTAAVTVTDKGDGTLETAVAYTPTDATITNTYAATGSVVIEVKKSLVGRDWLDKETYTFTLKKGNDVLEEKTVDKDNLTATFTAIPYTEADAGKTYTYTVSETTNLPGGLSNSGDITVEVAITDNGDGTLTATPTYSGGTGDGKDTITNSYEAEGEVTLEAIKVLEGRQWQEGETYTFMLFDSNGDPVDKQTISSDGKVTFDTIEYTQKDMVDENGNYSSTVTLNYTIEETTTLPDGMTNSGIINVEVTLVDDGEGNITVSEPTYTNENGEETNTITNTYTSSGKATLKVTKALEGAAWPEGETLTFTLAGVNGAPVPETTVKTLTAAGEVTFEIPYTQEDMKKGDKYATERDFEYTISEDGFENWTSSGNITAKVTLTDDGKGHISVSEPIYTNEAGEKTSTITNTYTATGSIQLEVNKKLKNAQLTAGAFTFNLTGEGEEKTASNDADGKVTFSAITYNQDDMVDDNGNYLTEKEFTYTIEEQNDGLKYYDYDGKTITATVTVTNTGDGNLATEVVYSEDGEPVEKPTFNNTYNASGSVSFTVQKILKGKTLEAGDFEFELVDKDGEVVQTQKNDEAGSVRFELEYTMDDLVDDESAENENTNTKGTGSDEDDSGKKAAAEKDSDKNAENAEGAEVAKDEKSEGEAATDDAATNEPSTDKENADGEEKENKEASDKDEGESSVIDLAIETLSVKYANADSGDTEMMFAEGEVNDLDVVADETTDNNENVDSDKKNVKVEEEAKEGEDADGNADGETAKENENVDSDKKDVKVEEEEEAIDSKVDESTETSEGVKAAAKGPEDDESDDEGDNGESEDEGKQFTYTIREKVNKDQTDYITFDDGVATVTVTVVDKGKGELEATYVFDEPEKTEFTNTYTSSGETTLTVTKELAVVEKWPEGQTLTLTLEGKDGAPVHGESTTTLEAAGDAGFNMTFSQADMEDGEGNYLKTRDFEYTISEDGFENWSGSGNVTAKVTLTENGDGTISVSDPVYTPTDATIINTFDPEFGTLIIEKKVNETPTSDVTFAFLIESTPESPYKYSNRASVTLTNGTSSSTPLEHIKAGTIVNVTEVLYVGGRYTIDGEAVQKNIEIKADEDGGPVTVTFNNKKGDVIINGSGIQNTYTYTESGWQFTKSDKTPKSGPEAE